MVERSPAFGIPEVDIGTILEQEFTSYQGALGNRDPRNQP